MFAPPSQRTTALINGRSIDVERSETLLQAALRQGIDFPNSCRVGGCGTCKCQLQDGQVKELTETGYLLSREEIDAGYILACQSVPQTDVRMASISPSPPERRVSGRIVGQERLTRDITRLPVQLDEALPYRAGQFAALHRRRARRAAQLLVRDSSVRLRARQLLRAQGARRQVLVVGERRGRRRSSGDRGRPAGRFLAAARGRHRCCSWQAAAGSRRSSRCCRKRRPPARGARRRCCSVRARRQDLYALEEIDAIAANGAARSASCRCCRRSPTIRPGRARAASSPISSRIAGSGAHAYLCGPPAMIDGAATMLHARGVPREHIHCDRFITHQEAALRSPSSQPAARHRRLRQMPACCTT